MIKEACSGDCEKEDDSLDIRTMFLLAVATSIDALAVGITFAFLDVHIIAAVSFIGVTTFVISAIGVKIGNVFGTKYKSKAEFAGGAILILLGVKILLEHLGSIQSCAGRRTVYYFQFSLTDQHLCAIIVVA